MTPATRERVKARENAINRFNTNTYTRVPGSVEAVVYEENEVVLQEPVALLDRSVVASVAFAAAAV